MTQANNGAVAGAGGILAGKRGLVMGVANERSIAWGIASALAAEGAELAFSYQGEAFGKRVEPLAASVGSDFLVDVDVTNEESLDAAFAGIKERWGRIDFLIHAIAYSDKNELAGRFADTSRGNFLNSMNISVFSFIDVARRAADLMTEGGSLITLTYGGSNRVTPYYNVMGVAKAALESSVIYLANDLGPQGIRVNAIIAGLMETDDTALTYGSAEAQQELAANLPLRRMGRGEDIAAAVAFLCSPLASFVSGATLEVHGGGEPPLFLDIIKRHARP